MTMFILGVLAMSFISAIVLSLCDPDSNVAVIIAGGPCLWIFTSLYYFVISPVTHWLIYHNRRSILKNHENGKYYYCKPKDYDFLYQHNALSWADHDTFDVYVDIWGKRFTNGNHVNLRYAPKRIWKQYEPVPEPIITSARKINAEQRRNYKCTK